MIELTGLAANQWHDIYELSNIGVGAALVVYNKGATNCLIWEGASAPGSASAGVPIGLDDPICVFGGSPGVWVRSMVAVSLNVQEIV